MKVWVVPGASSSQVVGLYGDRIKIRVTAPARRGRATMEASRVLQARLGSDVTLVRGMGSREKVFNVAGLVADEVLRKLGIV